MNIQRYKDITKPSKRYVKLDISSLDVKDPNNLSCNTIEGDRVNLSPTFLYNLAKSAGVPKSVSEYIYTEVGHNVWYDMIWELYKKLTPYVLLKEESDTEIKEKVFVGDIPPMSNEGFIDSMISSLKDHEYICGIYDISYDKVSTKSSVLVYTTIKSLSDLKLGVVFMNDEDWQVSCRLYVRDSDDAIYYLPKSVMSLTSGRYNRSSENNNESLNQLILRVVDALTSKEWDDVLCYFRTSLANTATIKTTYEEYNYVLKSLKVAALSSDMEEEVKDIEDRVSLLDDFESNYYKKDYGSYLWRCTAYSDNTISRMITTIISILSDYQFYVDREDDLRILLGDLVINRRILTELAPRRD